MRTVHSEPETAATHAKQNDPWMTNERGKRMAPRELAIRTKAYEAAIGWGRPEQCEAAAFVKAVGSLLPPPPAGALGPFALSESGALEEFAARGGLTPGARREVLYARARPQLFARSRRGS
jgi:hypothetical protein